MEPRKEVIRGSFKTRFLVYGAQAACGYFSHCDQHARCVDEPEEQVSMVFITNHEPAKVLEPAVGAFHLPAIPVAAQFAPILRRSFAAIGAVWTDQVDVAPSQSLPKRIAVSGAVVDKATRTAPQQLLLQQRFDERDFGGAGTVEIDGQRDAVSVDQGHDLASLAALGFPDEFAPFFARAKLPSASASSQSILWNRSRSRSRRAHAFWNVPSSVQSFNRLQQVAGDGKIVGKSFQRAPDRNTQRMPSRHARGGTRGRPPRRPIVGCGNRSSITTHCASVSSSRGSVMDTAWFWARRGHHASVKIIGISPFIPIHTQVACQSDPF